MKINALSIVLFVLLAISVIFNFNQNKKHNPNEKEKLNAVLTTIFERKSVRDYTSQPIPKETLNLLVKAGMAAPSAKDIRPWKFVVITDRAILDSLASQLPYAKMLLNAPAAIVVCGNTDTENNGSTLWEHDCSAASENILLAAESLGLGAVWTAVYPYKERIAPTAKFLNLPDNILPLNIIPVGYPKQKNSPKDKYTPKNIYYNQYK